jgi:hypothetical protein
MGIWVAKGGLGGWRGFYGWTVVERISNMAFGNIHTE